MQKKRPRADLLYDETFNSDTTVPSKKQKLSEKINVDQMEIEQLKKQKTLLYIIPQFKPWFKGHLEYYKKKNLYDENYTEKNEKKRGILTPAGIRYLMQLLPIEIQQHITQYLVSELPWYLLPTINKKYLLEQDPELDDHYHTAYMEKTESKNTFRMLCDRGPCKIPRVVSSIPPFHNHHYTSLSKPLTFFWDSVSDKNKPKEPEIFLVDTKRKKIEMSNKNQLFSYAIKEKQSACEIFSTVTSPKNCLTLYKMLLLIDQKNQYEALSNSEKKNLLPPLCEKTKQSLKDLESEIIENIKCDPLFIEE